MEKDKRHFLDLNKQDWENFVLEHGEKKFRAEQIQIWIKERFVGEPQKMSNLGKNLQDKLLEQLDWSLPEMVDRLDSEDGSTKILFKKLFRSKI